MSDSMAEYNAEEVYPSYASFRRRETVPFPSIAILRLIWPLDGPLSSLQVMNEACDPDTTLEPYFSETPSGTQIHPIASMPVTRHKISSVSVHLTMLRRWAEDWEAVHQHAEEGMTGCIFGEAEDGETDPPLLRCCGEERPRDTLALLIRASEKPYLTVHDYVSAVHPWLMSLKNRILGAKNVWGDLPVSRDAKLLVANAGDDDLSIQTWDEWLHWARYWANVDAAQANT